MTESSKLFWINEINYIFIFYEFWISELLRRTDVVTVHGAYRSLSLSLHLFFRRFLQVLFSQFIRKTIRAAITHYTLTMMRGYGYRYSYIIMLCLLSRELKTCCKWFLISLKWYSILFFRSSIRLHFWVLARTYTL